MLLGEMIQQLAPRGVSVRMDLVLQPMLTGTSSRHLLEEKLRALFSGQM